ncbi:hypothetical protein B0H10DRAFT_2206232 [Mycena sp. CBHHK59/15]|nr:hypothetical protein B0H10DRAFT_2206232 [Mycena sp. CBHHK59/15]
MAGHSGRAAAFSGRRTPASQPSIPSFAAWCRRRRINPIKSRCWRPHVHVSGTHPAAIALIALPPPPPMQRAYARPLRATFPPPPKHVIGKPREKKMLKREREKGLEHTDAPLRAP